MLDSGLDICTIFLDYSTAFDTLPCRLLLQKLRNANIPPHIFNGLYTVYMYLCWSSQYVCVSCSSSEPPLVPSGVPQGLYIGTALVYILYHAMMPLWLLQQMVWCDSLWMIWCFTTIFIQLLVVLLYKLIPTVCASGLMITLWSLMQLDINTWLIPVLDGLLCLPHLLQLMSPDRNESILINILMSRLLPLSTCPCKLLRFVGEEGRIWVKFEVKDSNKNFISKYSTNQWSDGYYT